MLTRRFHITSEDCSHFGTSKLVQWQYNSSGASHIYLKIFGAGYDGTVCWNREVIVDSSSSSSNGHNMKVCPSQRMLKIGSEIYPNLIYRLWHRLLMNENEGQKECLTCKSYYYISLTYPVKTLYLNADIEPDFYEKDNEKDWNKINRQPTLK